MMKQTKQDNKKTQALEFLIPARHQQRMRLYLSMKLEQELPGYTQADRDRFVNTILVSAPADKNSQEAKMRIRFRQFSQLPGMIPRPVYNYIQAIFHTNAFADNFGTTVPSVIEAGHHKRQKQTQHASKNYVKRRALQQRTDKRLKWSQKKKDKDKRFFRALGSAFGLFKLKKSRAVKAQRAAKSRRIR
jgi:hypothetical protein